VVAAYLAGSMRCQLPSQAMEENGGIEEKTRRQLSSAPVCGRNGKDR
jgi:hypothetical protein